MSFNREPQLGKNFWLAMALSFLVLMGYPFFIRWISPERPPQETTIEKQEAPSQTQSAPEAIYPAKETVRDTFLEKPSPPEEFRFENEIYAAKFSTLGGSISDLFYKGADSQNGNFPHSFYAGDPTQPGSFGIKILHDREDLTRAIFKISEKNIRQGTVDFVYERPSEYRLTKRYIFSRTEPVIRMNVLLENLTPREKHFPLELSFGLDYEKIENQQFEHFESVIWTHKAETANVGKIAKKGFRVDGEISWAGLIRQYFALLVKPDWKTLSGESSADTETLWTSLRMEPISVPGNAVKERNFLIYAGPQRYEVLKSFGLGFENILSRGFFGIFQIWLLIALKFCNQLTHNFGWSIILVTLAIKAAFTPLTHISFESMKKMQALQPKLKNIQERYKSDPAKMNKEMMGLYKRNKVNPMSGCLPMLLQIPIFFAFYRVLSEAIELHGAPFIGWITDLSAPDRLFTFPFDIPLIGDGLNVLPILMLLSMFWQQKLTPQAGATPEQTKIMAFMPLIFGFIFYKMPSGLVLYWFVSNVLSIIHQVFVKRMVIVLHHEDRD